MFLYLQTYSGNRQAAADAIQRSIFGSRDEIIEGPVEMMVYDHRGQGGGRNRGYTQRFVEVLQVSSR